MFQLIARCLGGVIIGVVLALAIATAFEIITPGSDALFGMVMAAVFGGALVLISSFE